MGWIRDAVGKHLCKVGPDAWLLASLRQRLVLQFEPLPTEVLGVEVDQRSIEVGPFPLLRRDKLSNTIMETDRLNNPTGTELPQHSLCLTFAREEALALLMKYFVELDPILCNPVSAVHRPPPPLAGDDAL